MRKARYSLLGFCRLNVSDVQRIKDADSASAMVLLLKLRHGTKIPGEGFKGECMQ